MLFKTVVQVHTRHSLLISVYYIHKLDVLIFNVFYHILHSCEFYILRERSIPLCYKHEGTVTRVFIDVLHTLQNNCAQTAPLTAMYR